MKKIILLLAIVLLSSCGTESKNSSSDMQFASFYEGSPVSASTEKEEEKEEKKSNFSFEEETDNFACSITCTEK